MVSQVTFPSGAVLHLLYECTTPNTRLKLTAPVVCGTIAFVIIPAQRRSLAAFR